MPDFDTSDISKFVINAARWREICEINIGHLKNPLFSINKNGEWAIYYHIENWIGSVSALAITNLTETYQDLANQWLDLIDDYDPLVPSEVNIRVFGFVFNQGVELDGSFYEIYGDYPIVTNWQGTNEESPWEIRLNNNNDRKTLNRAVFRPIFFVEILNLKVTTIIVNSIVSFSLRPCIIEI